MHAQQFLFAAIYSVMLKSEIQSGVLGIAQGLTLMGHSLFQLGRH